MCVHMFVCVCVVFVYVCAYVHLCVCLCVFVCVLTYVHLRICSFFCLSLYASIRGQAEWTSVYLNFTNVFARTCGSSDYEAWEPWNDVRLFVCVC